MPDGEWAGSGCFNGVSGHLVTKQCFWMGRSGHPCPSGTAQGLGATATYPLQPETLPGHRSTETHSSSSAEDIQSIYLIIDMPLRVIISSEAPVCARNSETCVSPCCFTPGMTHLLLHLQQPVLQNTAAWVHSIPPSTQKCEMTVLLVRSLLQNWEQVLLCEIKEAPKGILSCFCH